MQGSRDKTSLADAFAAGIRTMFQPDAALRDLSASVEITRHAAEELQHIAVTLPGHGAHIADTELGRAVESIVRKMAHG